MDSTRSDRRPPVGFLELLYPSPRPLATLEEWRRAHHDDLTDLPDLELARDLSRVWRRITLEWPPPDSWLWERRAAIFAERDRRRMAGRRP